MASHRKITTAFDFFLEKRSTNNSIGLFNNVEVKMVYSDFKRIAYDSKNYKWSLKNCISFIDGIPFLSSKDFVAILNELKNKYYSENNVIGKIGLEKFIYRLKQSKKFMQSKYDFGGIKLNDDIDIFEFIQDLKTLHNHLNISQNDFVKFVFKNFKTGYAESTLRRYYYDETY